MNNSGSTELRFEGQTPSLTALIVIIIVAGMALVLGGFTLAYPYLVRVWGDGPVGMTLTILSLMVLLLLPLLIPKLIGRRLDQWAVSRNLGGRVVVTGDKLIATGPRNQWQREMDIRKQIDAEAILVHTDLIQSAAEDPATRIPRITTVELEQDKLSIGLMVSDDVDGDEEIPTFDGLPPPRTVSRYEKHPYEIQLTRVQVQVLLNRLPTVPRQS